MNCAHGREAIESVVVLVPTMIRAGLDELAGPESHPMIEGHKQRLQILGFVGIERRIHVRPAEALPLVAGEQVGLRRRIRALQPHIGAIEFVFTVGNGAV